MEEPLGEPEAIAAERAAAGSAGTPERRSRWSLALKVAGVSVVFGLLALLVWATLAAGRGSSLVARIAADRKPAAPRFNLPVLWPHAETWPPPLTSAIADAKLDLSELRGRPVVLNFWASWCVPCRQEAPILHAAALRHRGEAAFVGVDVRDLSGDALAFARKYKLNYVSVRDGGGDKTWNSYGLTGVPESYFLDRRGRIAAHVPGAVSTDTLEEGVATITRRSGGGTLQSGAHVRSIK